jgi:hypothetical protein
MSVVVAQIVREEVCICQISGLHPCPTDGDRVLGSGGDNRRGQGQLKDTHKRWFVVLIATGFPVIRMST